MLTKPPFLLIRSENVVSYFHTESRSPREKQNHWNSFSNTWTFWFQSTSCGYWLKELQILSPSLSLTNHNELDQCLCFHLHFCLGIWINKITGKKKKTKTFPEATHRSEQVAPSCGKIGPHTPTAGRLYTPPIHSLWISQQLHWNYPELLRLLKTQSLGSGAPPTGTDFRCSEGNRMFCWNLPRVKKAT